MKNLFFTLVFGSLISLLLTGCSKDETTVPVDQIIPPTSTGFNMLRQQALADLVQTQTFDAGDGIHFVSNKGTILDIGQYELTDHLGNTIVGEVELTF